MKKLLISLGISNLTSFRFFVLQFLKFGIIGVSNTVIALAIYYVLVFFSMHYLIANTIAFALSVLNAYYWNSKYTFETKEYDRRLQIVRIYLAYGVTFLLGTGLMFLQVNVLGVSEWVAPIVNLCITVPLNFVLNKFWVFK